MARWDIRRAEKGFSLCVGGALERRGRAAEGSLGLFHRGAVLGGIKDDAQERVAAAGAAVLRGLTAAPHP
jgi:hypothetical protein